MRSHTDRTQSQRGVALFIAIFALMLLTAVGMALMYAGDTETSINSNFRSAQAAYYAAKAGLEEGRERLRYGNTYTIPWAGANANLLKVFPNTANGNGVVYILNPTAGDVAIQPWAPGTKYFDDELCHENYAGLGLGFVPLGVPCTIAPAGAYYTLAPTGWPNSSLDPGYNTAAAMPYKWVRITLKQVGSTSPYCVDGAASCGNVAQDPNFNRLVCAKYASNQPYELMNPGPIGSMCESNGNMKTVYLVTALAITNTGARRMVQYEVAAISMPPFPAALTMDGDGPFLIPPTSNAFTVSGNDKNSCGVGAPNMPGIGAISDPAKTEIVNDINNPPNGQPRPQNYTGSSGATPDVQNVNITPQPMDPLFSTCAGLHTLYNTLTGVADQILPSNPSGAKLGTPTSPMISIVNGDFTLDTTNAGGAGVLLVTGNMTFNGNPPFDGVILVIGKGQVTTSSGGGNGNLYGAMLVANCFDANGNWTTGAPGSPSFDWSKGGGTYNIQYDSCWVNNLGNHSVYKVLASREEMY